MCKNGKWSSNRLDILNDALGICDYDGDIKMYNSDCSYYPKGEFFVCVGGTDWHGAEGSDIPPGMCSDVGSKRRIDGVCYVCGEDKKWQTVDCE